jgi:hypothetical protein
MKHENRILRTVNLHSCVRPNTFHICTGGSVQNWRRNNSLLIFETDNNIPIHVKN